MKPTKPFDAKAVARELRAHLEFAVGDIASDMLSPHGGMHDDKWAKRIKEARRDKVKDLRGWLADALFNDPDCICDTIGDRLHDKTSSIAERIAVLDVLLENAFPGMRTACERMKQEQLDQLHVNPDTNRY